MTTPRPHPLLFEPILLEKVWGGRRLGRLGKRLPPGRMIGESWEVADLSATSASGAGGGAMRSVIAQGPLAGRTLHDVMDLWKEALIPSQALTADGNFPLLVKFLDASQNLSVQVHPSPAYALANPGAHLKTECWYILDAEPGSVIYTGVRPGVDRERFLRRVREGTVADDLIAVPAVAGRMHNLPSGTVHALGAGVMVAEIQTPSDTTFRVFDWGRTGRELHLEQAMACIDFTSPPPTATSLDDDMSSAELVRTEHFAVTGVRITPGGNARLPDEDACLIVVLLEGQAVLRSGGGAFADQSISAGQTVLLPAAVALGAEITSQTGTSALIARAGA